MAPADVSEIVAETIWVILIAAGPALTVAMAVGLGIALLQALTSVQEMTLTFVPKLAAIFVCVALTLPLIYATLFGLSERVFDLIQSGAI
ncbi:flagellar biosynthetic protein FliQ [Marivita sp.]|uniref:flagellar biosynthetic protein FliQ n=1 Tax=Marivita sp. TaxID=2003365 RepID=UPI0025C19F5D|nr:flagellar biosynthetic protein FliQ [Marivita sp.]